MSNTDNIRNTDNNNSNLNVVIAKGETAVYALLTVTVILCYIFYQLGVICEKISWDEQQILDIKKEIKVNKNKRIT